MSMDYKTLFSETKDLTLLLVEDYEPLRNDMAEMLEDLFKTVKVAVNGKEALGLYQEYYERENRCFDLVVTDIQMPFMNGVELSEAIQNIIPDQQIIVLSAHKDSDYLLKLINLGIAQFITKPIDHQELMKVLYLVSKKINLSNLRDHEDILLIDLGEDYIWDKDKLVLKKGEDLIDLTRNELLLLQLMIRKSKQICTNEDIVNDFYANNIDISEASIRNMVFKLRKKLPECAVNSIYGLGYKLIPKF